MEAIIELKDIKKAYGQTEVLNHFNLSIDQGEFITIIGTSGSGKTTVLKMINGLIQPTSGHVKVHGQDIQEQDLIQLRRHMGYVIQGSVLFPHLTVKQNIAYVLQLEKKTKNMDQIVDQWLETVQLDTSFKDKYPHTLSGGQQQRVGIARALANQPDILLMDEAFSALDPLIRTEMQDELVKLQAKHQRTIVFISHDLDEAMRIGDRIAIMQNGEVVQVGTPDEILNNPANDYVRTFFRGVDISQVFSAKDIARRTPNGLIRKTPGFGPRSALKLLQDEDREYGYVIERGNKFVGAVSIRVNAAARS